MERGLTAILTGTLLHYLIFWPCLPHSKVCLLPDIVIVRLSKTPHVCANCCTSAEVS